MDPAVSSHCWGGLVSCTTRPRPFAKRGILWSLKLKKEKMNADMFIFVQDFDSLDEI